MAHLPPPQVDTFLLPLELTLASPTSTSNGGSPKQILALYATSTRPKKTLQFILITHAHGDHFFGAPILQTHFPGVTIIATATVAAGMPEQYTPEMYENVWKVLFPDGQLSKQQVCATALPNSNEFVLDGHILKAYDVSADHKESSILHVPSLDLVACGDVVYGDCHQYFVEANTAERRRLWLDALDVVDGLNPKIVVASHKRASQIDGSYLVAATRKYIIDFESLAAQCNVGGWQTLYQRIQEAYPHHWNDFLLEASCKAYFSIDPFSETKVALCQGLPLNGSLHRIEPYETQLVYQKDTSALVNGVQLI